MRSGRSVGIGHVACVLVIVCADAAHAETPKVQSIFAHMVKLRPLIGSWTAAVDFHDRDGSVTAEEASYVIKPVLDGTYLEWDVTVYRKDNPGRRHSFMIMTTYNPDTAKYDQTYFYSRSATRVTEAGEFDDASKEFRTTAFVPREDGVHDESVRTITSFIGNGRIEHWHFSLYNNEKAELMNFHAKMLRSQ